MSEKMREYFEKFAADHYQLCERSFERDQHQPDEYLDTDCQLAWEAWEASRAALVVELPAAEFGVSPEIEDDEEYEAAEAISMCEDAVLSRVRKHIEAQGLKVAP